MTAPSKPTLLGVAAACALGAGASLGFVSAPAGGRHGSLRASAPAPPQATTAGAVASGNSGSAFAICAAGSFFATAAAAARGVVARRAEAKAKKAKKEFVIESVPRPEDLLESPKFPMFMGSSGGYMAKATRERHAITWTAKESFVFELPTAGVAVMNKGENLCYFRKKEQCIALGKQLRKMKIEDYKIYRIKKDGTVIFMHPADGVFPEKVNKGRVQVNGRPFSIGRNPNTCDLKWTKYAFKSYEADALTTLFIKARTEAYKDTENLYALPNPEFWMDDRDFETYQAKLKEKSM